MVLEAILHPTRLPSIPRVGGKDADAASQPNCLPGDVRPLIANDLNFQPLALLQAVNSARDGPAALVGSVDRAVLVVGLNQCVRTLALSIAARDARRPGSCPRAGALAEVGERKAMFARELAILRGYPSPEDELNAALLRDIGVLLISADVPGGVGELRGARRRPAGRRSAASESGKCSSRPRGSRRGSAEAVGIGR